MTKSGYLDDDGYYYSKCRYDEYERNKRASEIEESYRAIVADLERKEREKETVKRLEDELYRAQEAERRAKKYAEMARLAKEEAKKPKPKRKKKVTVIIIVPEYKFPELDID